MLAAYVSFEQYERALYERMRKSLKGNRFCAFCLLHHSSYGVSSGASELNEQSNTSQTANNTYDGNGNINQRVWISSLGVTSTQVASNELRQHSSMFCQRVVSISSYVQTGFQRTSSLVSDRRQITAPA
jgi:hypothetical protein